MENRLNIATLIHPGPDRAAMLDTCVRSLLHHTDIPWPLSWAIYCNGTSDELKSVIHGLQETFHDRINIVGVYSEVNKGLGAGINACNALSEGFEYTLLLEGDWLCLHAQDSGQPCDWLTRSVELLDREQDADAVYLRRFFCDTDSRQTGLHYHYRNLVRPSNLDDSMRYFVCDIPYCTNNPLVRRNKRFYEKGCFPFHEQWQGNIPREVKGNPEWGLCEILAERKLAQSHTSLRYAILQWGVFAHMDNSSVENMRLRRDKPGCQTIEGTRCQCRWGYYRQTPHFCALCKAHYRPHELMAIFAQEGYFLQEVSRAREQGDGALERLKERWNDNPSRPLSDIKL